LRAFETDVLAEAKCVEQPDVRRHQDHHEREGEQRALDELDGHRAAPPDTPPPRTARTPSTTRSSPTPRDALRRTTSPSRRRGGRTSSAASASGSRVILAGSRPAAP